MSPAGARLKVFCLTWRCRERCRDHAPL